MDGIRTVRRLLKKLMQNCRCDKGIGEDIRGFKSAMKAEEEKAINPTTIIANEQSLTNG